MQNQMVRRWEVLAFLGIEAALYLSFLYLDLFVPAANATPLKYASIVLCFLTAFWWARRGGDTLVAWGLALTLGADTFLLLLNRWYLVGILFFYGVQVVYLVRILKANGGRALLLGRAVLFAALLLLLLKLGAFTPITAAAALYISHFFFNLAQSLGLRGREGKSFFWGLLLYFCCDLCVGTYNAPGLFPAPLYEFSRIGMWLFYLPGQVLIVLSGLKPLQGEMKYDKTK